MGIKALLLAALLLQDPSRFEELRDHILPRAEELKWTEIPWRATFWESMVEAQGQDKPILLWAMNGHPLALT